MKNYYCKCGNKIDRHSIRCLKCWHKSIKGSNSPVWKGGWENNLPICQDCGRKLKNMTAIRCKSCARKYQYATRPETHPMLGVKGENVYNWIKDRSLLKYSDEFNTVLKEQIRKRDNYECQNCGMTEEEHLIVIGTDLHVHHIDYNKKNYSKYNLITTCLSCNTRANYNRNYWKKFYTQKIKEIIKCNL